MRRHVLFACLLTALAVPAFPSDARADDAAVAEAQQRFQEGLELADAKQHEPARLKFQQAWAVFKAPAVLYNLARSEQLTGHDLEALEHYRTFVKISATDPKITDAMREKAAKNVEELAKRVGQIELEVPSAARVTVDGKPVEPPASGPRDPVPVAPGRHMVEATFEGKLKSVTVECTAGSTTRAKIEFESGGSFTEPPGTGERRASWSTARFVTVGTLSGAAIAGGVLFFVFRGAAQQNVEDARALLGGRSCVGLSGTPDCEAAASLKDDRDGNVTASTVSLIAGAAFAAGALGAAFAWPRSTSASARIVPVISPTLGGASFAGTF